MPDSLADRIQGLLVKNELSQSQLARRLGIDQTAISRIIARPTYQPGAFVLYKIAQGLGTTVDALLSGIVQVEVPAPASVDSTVVARLTNEITGLKMGQNNLERKFDQVLEAIADLKKPAKPERQKAGAR